MQQIFQAPILARGSFTNNFPYSYPYSQEKSPRGGPAQDSLADEFIPVRIK